jgi:uncharacterized protein YkwD
MNGRLIVVVFVLFLLGYVFSKSPNPTPNILASDYATTIATVATVAAYESLSETKEVVQDLVVGEVAQEIAEQMEVLTEPVVQEVAVQEPVTIPVSQTIEIEVASESSVENPVEPSAENLLDDNENVAWKKLNDLREQAGLKRLTFAPDLLDGCRKHADNQRKRKSLWHAFRGENCAVSRDEGGELPIRQWLNSTKGHREFMLSRNISEGAIARSNTYWVFRARQAAKTVTIVEDTGDVNDADKVEVKEKSVQNCVTGNSCVTGYASDGQRTVKTYTRTGRHRPLRYALWRTFN